MGRSPLPLREKSFDFAQQNRTEKRVETTSKALKKSDSYLKSPPPLKDPRSAIESDNSSATFNKNK